MWWTTAKALRQLNADRTGSGAWSYAEPMAWSYAEPMAWSCAEPMAKRTVRMRALLWEDRLGQLAKRLKVALDRLRARKSAEPKVRLAAAMKAVSTVSNVWLAERLKMGRPARVSQYVRRFRLRGGGNAGSCEAAVPRVNT